MTDTHVGLFLWKLLFVLTKIDILTDEITVRSLADEQRQAVNGPARCRGGKKIRSFIILLLFLSHRV